MWIDSWYCELFVCMWYCLGSCLFVNGGCVIFLGIGCFRNWVWFLDDVLWIWIWYVESFFWNELVWCCLCLRIGCVVGGFCVRVCSVVWIGDGWICLELWWWLIECVWGVFGVFGLKWLWWMCGVLFIWCWWVGCCLDLWCCILVGWWFSCLCCRLFLIWDYLLFLWCWLCVLMCVCWRVLYWNVVIGWLWCCFWWFFFIWLFLYWLCRLVVGWNVWWLIVILVCYGIVKFVG